MLKETGKEPPEPDQKQYAATPDGAAIEDAQSQKIFQKSPKTQNTTLNPMKPCAGPWLLELDLPGAVLIHLLENAFCLKPSSGGCRVA